MKKLYFCVTFSLTFCFALISSSEAYSARHTNIVILGATGNLAKRYLWQGFFNLFIKYREKGQSFTFYAAGRAPADTSNSLLTEIFDKELLCPEELKINNCMEIKNNFKHLVSYSVLKNETDYSTFCSKMLDNRMNSEKASGEIIFYLSIPTSSYISVAENINKHCRPKNGKIKLHIILEKPFGNDKASAVTMGNSLAEHFKEDEIFRVDHYLGKTIVCQILAFRSLNKQIEDKLNKDEVERVEIFMKETVGVKGRIDFFDQTGIIRDIFQNHLTELLTLVGMDLPQNLSLPEQVKTEKLKLLHRIKPVVQSSVLIGQYSDYVSEVKNETKGLKNTTLTPTFAAAMLFIDSPRWTGVPFILAGGKKLNEKSSFVRILFKQNIICVSCTNNSKTQQLIFQIGHGIVKSPAIIVSKSLGSPKWPAAMSEVEFDHGGHLFGDHTSDLLLARPVSNHDAYTVLIEDIFIERRDNFVGTHHLLALWDIWTHIITETEKKTPRIYKAEDKEGLLDFVIKGSQLTFRVQDPQKNKLQIQEDSIHTPATFLGYKLISCSCTQIAKVLAEDISKSVHSSLKNNWTFHIAFSGGNSPKLLLQELAQSYTHLPWEKIHVWQVDERCVPFTDYQSNFYHLQELLLRFVPIPHQNIHPMPVDINGKLCAQRDMGKYMYKESMKYHIPDLSFDYVVLGVGDDGHTASLFPHSPLLKTDALVEIADSGMDTLKYRMTLTLAVINKSKHISVLVSGKKKSMILNRLEKEEGFVSDFPVLGVKPVSGKLVWFIDKEAMSDT